MNSSKCLLWLVILMAVVFPLSSHASSWLRCEVLAQVEEVRNKNIADATSAQEVKIRLLRNPYSCEGHGISQTLSIGQTLWIGIELDAVMAKVRVGTKLKLNRKVYKGMGPNGLVESDDWSVKEALN